MRCAFLPSRADQPVGGAGGGTAGRFNYSQEQSPLAAAEHVGCVDGAAACRRPAEHRGAAGGANQRLGAGAETQGGPHQPRRAPQPPSRCRRAEGTGAQGKVLDAHRMCLRAGIPEQSVQNAREAVTAECATHTSEDGLFKKAHN